MRQCVLFVIGAGVACIAGQASGQALGQALGQGFGVFDEVLNIGDDPAAGVVFDGVAAGGGSGEISAANLAGSIIGESTQLNLYGGGRIAFNFTVGLTTTPVGTSSLSVLNIFGGTVERNLTIEAGANVNMSGGQILQSIFTGFSVFVTPGGTLTVTGGSIEGTVEAQNNSVVTIEGGLFTNALRAFPGSTVAVSGGEITQILVDGGTDFEISGGDARNIFIGDNGVVDMTGGISTRGFEVGSGGTFNLFAGDVGLVGVSGDVGDGTFNVFGGTVGRNLDAGNGGVINISGGSIGNDARARSGGVISLTAGSIGTGAEVERGGTFNFSGVSIGAGFEAESDSVTNIYGSGFTLGGGLIPFLVEGVPLEITGRDTILRGTLAGGAPIELDLASSLVDQDATLTITVVAAGCEVAHFAEPRTTLDAADLVEFIGRAERGEAGADFDGDGSIDFFDVSGVLNAASGGCELPF